MRLLEQANQFISKWLTLLIILAAILGLVASPFATTLNGIGITSYLLALMMFGSGLSLSLRDIVEVKGTLKVTLIALSLQLGLLPPLSFGLYLLLPDPGLAIGMLAIGVAPSEITSALMTFLAGGNLALAMRLMTFSIFLSVFLTPLWLGLFLGKTVPLDISGIALELSLIIALPFLVGSGIRSRFSALAAYNDTFGSLSALAVTGLIFVVGGSLAKFNLNWTIIGLGVACLVFNVAGYFLGWFISWFTNQSPPYQTALIFSSGMREFGIATALALNFLPVGAALAPALYGLIMMFTASMLAARFRRQVSFVAPGLLNQPDFLPPPSTPR